ncbi:MAG: hypothetical protein JST04_12775 [Bdellovibrionales bacterium]|nr:hypothetical protein [Bdellovibrionales bacterium]
MLQFEVLGSLMRDLHAEFVSMYYLLLPVFFMLAIVVAWFRSPGGTPDYLDILKRAIVATILLTAFPDISAAIVSVADAITERIDKLNSLEAFNRMAAEKVKTYPMSPITGLFMFNDLVLSILSFLSYLFVYCANYLTMALYQFFWVFFSVSAPLLLLFNLFPGTSQITANLFRGMIEVASWKIVWAILGSMLAALSFADIYSIEGSYVVLIVMNFVIAIAMLMTPMMVRSIVGGGLQHMSSALGGATIATLAALPAKAAMADKMGRSFINRFSGSGGSSSAPGPSPGNNYGTRTMSRGESVSFASHPANGIPYKAQALPSSEPKALPPPKP